MFVGLLIVLLGLFGSVVGVSKRDHGGQHSNPVGDQWAPNVPSHNERIISMWMNAWLSDPSVVCQSTHLGGVPCSISGQSHPMLPDFNLFEACDVGTPSIAILQNNYYCARGPIIGNCVFQTFSGSKGTGPDNAAQIVINTGAGTFNDLSVWWLYGLGDSGGANYNYVVGQIDWEEGNIGNGNPIYNGYFSEAGGTTKFYIVYWPDDVNTPAWEASVIIDGTKFLMTKAGRAVYVYDSGSLMTGCHNFAFLVYWKTYNTDPNLRKEIVFRWPQTNVLKVGSGCASYGGVPDIPCQTYGGLCGAHGVCFQGNCICATGWALGGNNKCSSCVSTGTQPCPTGTCPFCPPVCTQANCTVNKTTPFWYIDCGYAQPDGCGGYNDCGNACTVDGYHDPSDPNDVDSCDTYDGGRTGICCYAFGACYFQSINGIATQCARSLCSRIKNFYNNDTSQYCKVFTDPCGQTMDCYSTYYQECTGSPPPAIQCPPPNPQPTCASRGWNCGNQDPTCTAAGCCGSYVNCGTCNNGQTCISGVCTCPQGSTTCCLDTCAARGYTCGSYTPTGNNCAGTLSCGTCPAGSSCQNFQCIATGQTGTGTQAPTCPTCTSLGKNCGYLQVTNPPAGCPSVLNCGTCNGYCYDNVCGSNSSIDCSRPVTTCAQFNFDCGNLPQGQCPPRPCGTCGAGCTCINPTNPAWDTSFAGGRCNCPGQTCTPPDCGGKICGSASNACGSTISCGTCSGGNVCNPSGTLCVPPLTTATAPPPPIAGPPTSATCSCPFACCDIRCGGPGCGVTIVTAATAATTGGTPPSPSPSPVPSPVPNPSGSPTPGTGSTSAASGVDAADQASGSLLNVWSLF